MRIFSLRLAAGVLLCGLPSAAMFAVSCDAQETTSTQGTNPPAAVHPAFPTGTATPLGAQIESLVNDPSVSRAHWGIAVTAMDGTPIYGLDEGKLFRPASNAKLFTTAAAMAMLGPKFTVSTKISFPTPGADGVVHGDLTIVGYGDDNLSGRTVPYVKPSSNGSDSEWDDPLRGVDELVDQVTKAGVKHVAGAIIASDWPWDPYPEGWSTDDMLWGYGAPVSGLAVDDNTVRLTVTPGVDIGGPATVTLTPDVGYFKIVSTARTTDDEANQRVTIWSDPGSRTLYVSGLVLGKPYTADIAVDDPQYYAGLALKHELETHGVQVDGAVRTEHEIAQGEEDFLRKSREPIELPLGVKATPGNSMIADYFGPPLTTLSRPSVTLADDLTVTLKESLNLHAEMILRNLWKTPGENPTLILDEGPALIGERILHQWLVNAGIDDRDFVFYDGSGLSTKDLVAPRAVAQLLAYAAKQPWFAQWKAALPVGGEDGTLSSRFPDPPLKDHLFAKTGTLGESRALSGYVDAASGKQVIFSIMVDDHAPNSSADRKVMDEIVAAIAAAN